ncbi:MAG: class I SAM-dependent methyltransferase [Planctomycetia bacterium]|nr:class I SAM-dependent methyltransferase [Planctomycetia bacterium]
MKATDRLRDENRFHDQQAAERVERFPDAASLRFEDDDFLNHETWIRPAISKLGSVAGMRTLDLGCGHAMAAVVLARAGADVTAIDLSAGYLEEAKRRAVANQVVVQFVQADATRLPFSDRSFDRVWGNAILHHLDIADAGHEVWRILRPGGVAVFCEPWGENPLLEIARRWVPYPGKARTPDERPLRQRDLHTLREIWPDIEVDGFQLLGMARRVLGHGALARGLSWCDGHLLKRVPGLNHYCRYAVITVRR